MPDLLDNLPLNPHDVRPLVDRVFSDAVAQNASDVHAEPAEGGYEIRFRVDGLLDTVARLPADVGRSVVTRLMVLAKLLTYRLDVPQEGRASLNLAGREVELRVSIMPTVQGLRAAVRLPTELAGPRSLDDLGFSRTVTESLKRFARAEAGMLVVTGPAGSGKTTTLYALLSHLAQVSKGISIVSLEDPVERLVPGVTQIEVKPFGELTYEKALRSILRQDPQVLMLGEIRDVATAQLATQAAMTGHRLITTLHASSTARAVSRLLDIGLEPYQLTSALHGVLAQRLVRRLAPLAPDGTSSPPAQLGSPHATRARDVGPTATPTAFPSPTGTDLPVHDEPQALPHSSHYRGRAAVGEILLLDDALRHAILSRADAVQIEQAARAQPGFTPLRHAAEALVAHHVTDPAEIDRVFGDATPPAPDAPTEPTGEPHP
jgi:type II secretory ATPase GspE/PulE/Tfp pilus assembly ATPase PilB-like protein